MDDAILPTAERPTASTPPTALVEVAGVEKVYRSGRLEYQALRGFDLVIQPGELTAIVGPSGCGKSTVLNIVTGIDRPTSGAVTVAGRDLGSMSEEELAVWRGDNVGIVFQFFQLLPTLTALENATIPMDFGPRLGHDERAARARQHLERVGLADKEDHLPSELSGGEQQRVAIARALARDPQLLVADEPTGNLDSETAGDVLALLTSLNEAGTTILYVTHDPELAGRARRVVTMRDGRVVDGG
jgi:putative ABC transport system ATP-binding protein